MITCSDGHKTNEKFWGLDCPFCESNIEGIAKLVRDMLGASFNLRYSRQSCGKSGYRWEWTIQITWPNGLMRLFSASTINKAIDKLAKRHFKNKSQPSSL